MKVVFLYDGPHPVHLAWAKSVGAVPVANRFNTRTDGAALKADPDDHYKKKVRGLELVKGITLRSLGLPASSYFQGLVQGAADIKELEADVLICEGRMCILPGHLFKRLRGGKTLLFAGDQFVWEVSRFRGRWRRTFERILEGFDGIIPVSRMMYRYLPPKAQKKARVVYPYFDGKYLRVGSRPDSRSIAYIGSLDERKGLDLSIEAFRLVRKRFPEARFRIIGRGPLREKYEGEEGLDFLGQVDDLGPSLSECSCYLHLARMEPWGITILEAMAGGLVPVVSEMTGAGEALEAVDAGLITRSPAEAARKLISLMEDPGLMRRLSGECRQAVRRWDRESSLGDFKNAFKELMGEAG